MAVSWRERLLAHAASLGRTTYAHDLGVGVEFEDGCDVFWALPGEVTSTVPIPAGGPATDGELVEAYDRIERVRGRAIHALRHYMASKNVRVDRLRGGSWPLQFGSGMSTSLSVGAYLTSVAAQTDDVYETVRRPLVNMWGLRPPSPARIDRYLRTAGPPPNERPTDEAATGTLFPQTVRVALACLGLCKLFDGTNESTTPDDIKAAAVPKGRIAKAMLRFGELLPDRPVSTDLMRPGSISIDFDDKQDQFVIDVRSRDLARQVGSDGPEAVAERLAAEFQSLNAARSAVFRAIRQASAARGWRQQSIGMAFFGIEDWTFLGATHREVRFRPAAPLTDALRTAAPEQVLRTFFTDQSPEFADACVRALHEPRPDATRELPEGSLLPTDVPDRPPLRELDAATIDDLDAFARTTLSTYLEGERTIWEYHNRDVWDSAGDTWATTKDWVTLAERHLEGDWPHPVAILILLDAGNPRAAELVKRYLDRAEPHHEVSDADVELVWRHRRERPDVAAKWFAPQVHQDVPFDKHRATLGDPVAARKRTVELSEQPASGDDDEPPAPETIAGLPAERQQAVRRQLVDWARTTHRWAGPDVERLRVAQAMGWADVADALEDNPFMLAGLLTTARREDQFDEPGLLLAKDFLFVWSRLSPSRLLARIIATARATDLIALATAASRATAERNPEAAKNVESSIDIYRIWHADLQPALAVAWTRCRSRLISP